MLKKFFRARQRIVENFEYVLRDANGNIKQLFKLNWLGSIFMKMKMITPHTSQALLAFLLLGSFVDKLVVSNLITNAGMAGAASRLNGAGSEAVFDYIAIGIGATAADVTDTTLDSEIVSGGGERAQGTASRTTTDVANDTARCVNTFTFTSSFAVVEAGLLNAASTGTLMNRQTFTAVNVVNGDSLQVTIDIDVDA